MHLVGGRLRVTWIRDARAHQSSGASRWICRFNGWGEFFDIVGSENGSNSELGIK